MVRYIIQRYTRFAIYEPAEGGYYYEGREPDDWCEIFNSLDEANKRLLGIVNDDNSEYEDSDGQREGILRYYKSGKYATAESTNHKYIGDGYDFFVEPINRRGRHRKGYEPYC